MASVTGKPAGLIQTTPGSISTVEAALATAFIAGDTAGAEALAAVLVYRIVSFVLVAVMGWITYALGFDYKDQPGYQPVADR